MFTFKHAGALEVHNDVYQIDLRAGYEGFFVGLKIKQQYLLLDPVATTLLETSLFPQLGHHWQWKLDNLIATELGVTAAWGFHVRSHSSNSAYKLRHQRGFFAALTANWQRILYTSERFPVHFFWTNQLTWEQTRRQVTGGVFNGQIKLQELGLVSMIGVGINF
jgi:hypothetical protein